MPKRSRPLLGTSRSLEERGRTGEPRGGGEGGGSSERGSVEAKAGSRLFGFTTLRLYDTYTATHTRTISYSIIFSLSCFLAQTRKQKVSQIFRASFVSSGDRRRSLTTMPSSSSPFSSQTKLDQAARELELEIERSVSLLALTSQAD
jgi:hypothetical protein